jgi:hypothetical protein
MSGGRPPGRSGHARLIREYLFVAATRICDKFDTTAAPGPAFRRAGGRLRTKAVGEAGGKSLLIFGSHVKPLAKKYSGCHVGQITGTCFARLAPARGAYHDRHDTWGAECDGRFGVRRFSRRTKTPRRTAKSCGPGAAMLALSLAGNFREVTVTTSPLHRGEHEVSRKAIAQGMSECSPLTCMLVCAFLCAVWHTRPRVQRAPGIPCALCFQEGQRI